MYEYVQGNPNRKHKLWNLVLP